jgi:hypothetical protein
MPLFKITVMDKQLKLAIKKSRVEFILRINRINQNCKKNFINASAAIADR